jgi:hypothetical protein
MIEREMHRRGVFMSFEPLASVSDKKARGRAYQRRHRARAMRFDKSASWYPGYENENMRFTGDSDAILDDQFDSTSILCRGLEEKTFDLEKEDFLTESEEDFLAESEFLRSKDSSGRNSVTGY